MDNRIMEYVNQVMGSVVAEESMKERIRKDLHVHIEDACTRQSVDEVLESMGSPEDVSREFMENIYENKDEIIQQLIKERIKVNQILEQCYEYKSRVHIGSLPLLHIKFRNRFSYKPAVAKGVIAIGDIAAGVLAIGGLSIGVIPIGGWAVGLFAFGGFSIGALLAVGGLALGSMAYGGLAIGLGSIGGFAIGKIAIGGYARGVVAIGGKAVGEHIISGNASNAYSLGHVPKEEIHNLIKTGYPQLSEWIINLFTTFGV